ncbi:hypothetical protein [Actinoallomurus iriomotensis]|uniref:DUF4386 family protein n=1 Tax=Actinoallomurus iriomotensis TaxID=478107 RepID=A0A9W6RNS2_9ACTN|nr:hypothetical protein [Actinoallomurus iriomotensis]GLY79676.1 hypothetical protein Airi01_079430 [Actinoallomurus iriomotensis]
MSTTTIAPRRSGLITTPAITGIAYTLSWIAGLSVGAPSPEVDSGGTAVVSAFAGHSAAVSAQFLFTEGLPAAGLAVVSLALARARAAGRQAGRGGSAGVAIAGVVAALISFIQFVLGVTLAGTSSPGTAHLLFDGVNRLDGIKMCTLAAMAVAAVSTGLLPRWLRFTGVALAAAIVASGVGYLLLIPSVATLAYVSGPLLLLFVTGTGIVLGRRER